MANRINYEKEMEKTLDALAARGERPRLLPARLAAPPAPAPRWNGWPGTLS